MYRIYLLCLLLTICSSFGGFFLKKSTIKQGGMSAIIRDINLYVGIIIYICGALLNVIVLRYLPYTIVMPISSIAYIWTILISYYFLNEKMKVKKIIGIFFILTGTICLVIFKK
ncbi:MAG: EamA family transporter [Bacillota bacterium]|nr:EamA family transporter [Bacillota bacterium]